MLQPSKRVARKRAASKSPQRTSAPAPLPGISLRAFAKGLQPPVSHTAIQKAVESGRLSKSVAFVKGRPRIADPQLAMLEWAAGAAKPHPNGDGQTLNEAQRQVAIERAIALQLSNSQKSRRLIDGEAARREAFECARTVRDAVLAVVDRVSAELAAERDAGHVRARLDEELRKALEAAAEVLAHGG